LSTEKRLKIELPNSLTFESYRPGLGWLCLLNLFILFEPFFYSQRRGKINGYISTVWTVGILHKNSLIPQMVQLPLIYGVIFVPTFENGKGLNN
jgi:hypothetical protein